MTRTEPNGSVTVLADSFEGGRLNAPNDVVVKSDGTIWFTDPSYGIATHFVGTPREKEQAVDGVYRLDPVSGALDRIAADFSKPNGLAFSPDETKLYIVDSGYLPDPAGPRHVRVFDVDADNAISGGDVLTEVKPGIPDGLRVDDAGRLWIGAGDGVHCVHPDGTLLGKVRVARGGGQRRLRRPQAQPSLHRGDDLAVRDLPQHDRHPAPLTATTKAPPERSGGAFVRVPRLAARERVA